MSPSGSKISASIPSTVFLISVCRRSKKNGRASSTAIPCCFTERDLKDFLDYILSEREPSIVHFKDGELYDADYVRLKRAALIDGGLDDFSIVREVLLSGATEVECLTNPPPSYATCSKIFRKPHRVPFQLKNFKKIREIS